MKSQISYRLSNNCEGEMRILLICASGMSTGILMKKMVQEASKYTSDFEIKACSFQDYEFYGNDFDVILLGPQLSYKLKVIEDNMQIPIGVIPGYDFAIGNAKAIFKLAEELISKARGKK